MLASTVLETVRRCLFAACVLSLFAAMFIFQGSGRHEVCKYFEGILRLESCGYNASEQD